jgi:protein-L-isoaspartate O-methyltransferase
VIPLGESQWDQVLWRIEKDQAGRLCVEKLGEVRFVPLIHSAPLHTEDAEQSAIRKELQRLGVGRTG